MSKSIFIMIVENDDLLKQLKDPDIKQIETVKQIYKEKAESFLPEDFNLNFSVNIAAEEGDDPQVIKKIEEAVKKILDEEREKGKIKTIAIRTDKDIKTKTLKRGYEEFLNYKKRIDKVSKKSIDLYNKSYKYLLLFTDEKEKIYTFTKKFFKETQNKMLNIPAHAILKYPNLKYEQIINIYEENEKDYKTLSAKTLNNIFTVWKNMFKYFEENDYITENPVQIKLLKEQTENIKNYETEELKKLYNELDEEGRDLMLIGLYTGMRIGEIASLKKEDIDLSNNFIFVREGKTENAKRKIPIHPHILNIFKKLITDKKEEEKLYNVTTNALQKRISKKLKNVINIENKSFHSFRKNFVQELYKNKIDENIIKVLVGHSTNDNITFNTYNLNKVEDEALQKAVNTLNFLGKIKEEEKIKNKKEITKKIIF